MHNTGVIRADVLPNLFQPLASGERRPRGSQGLGLGLFITHEIVKAHGGQISVRSDNQSGTTFTVRLPR